jgi:histidinol-phosphate aminotransferase
MTVRIRSALDTLPAYAPGRTVPGAIKLASNELSFPTLPSVAAAIADAVAHESAGINRYPDNGTEALIGALAEHTGAPPTHVVAGNGSVALCQQLVQATAGEGDEVLFGWRSFEAYPIVTQITGATPVRVPVTSGHELDLPAMAAAITPATRLIFVCTPNNPTGTVVSTGELVRFLDQVPGDCLVVLDEAYAEYVRDPAVPDGIEIYAGRPNVAVLRTFSKAYGLAGLRVGFLVGHEPVAAAARKTMLTFAVNAVAQAAAVASLAAEAELLDRVELVVAERDRIRAELTETGWTVPLTEANFVWLRLGPDTMRFADACSQAGLSVRPFAGEGVRVSVGEKAANDLFLEVARDFPGT